MKPEYHYIATLITRYLEGTISKGEEDQLNSWLEEDENNRFILDSFKGDAAVKDFEYLKSIDVDQGFLAVQRKQKAIQQKQRYRMLAAASIVLVLATIAWLSSSRFYTPKVEKIIAGNTVNGTVNPANDIKPGGHTAKLKLSDGSIKDLDNLQANFREQNQTEISSKNGQLVYSAAKSHAKELIYNEIIVPKKGIYSISLSDGTKVWLNSMSELRFPVSFSSKNRTVYLKGEGYFEVAKDSKRPFIVELKDKSKIEVLGTHFNVNSNTGTATLYEGSVKVFHNAKQKLLKPGQQAALDNSISIGTADLKRTSAWRNGLFYFKGDNIKEIMEEISVWYDIDVKYNNQPPETGYVGSIPRNVSLSKALQMLSYVTGADFIVEGKRVEINFN